MLKRYWISFISGYYGDEGCTMPPFQIWISGQMAREEESYDSWCNLKDDCSICAMVDANNEDEIWKCVAKHFPDYRKRFCNKQYGTDATPVDRFTNFKNETSLKPKYEFASLPKVVIFEEDYAIMN